MFTTNRLLCSIPADTYTWHSDATYKVTWHGYPLLVAGYTDRANHFHLAALSLCSTEKATDFAPLFKSVLDRRNDVMPKMLLTDASESMHNALPAEWSEATRGMCYVHVYRNIETAAKKMIKDQSKRVLFLKEFGDLSASWSKECYLTVRGLLVQKYSTDSEVTSVLDHYLRTWCTDRLQNHYSGVAPGYSMHNNGLEGKNGAIKFLATDFKQMSIPDFCNSISKFIQAESLEKDEKSNNFRPYKREPEIKSLTYTAVSMAVYNKSYSVYQTGLDDDRKIYALSRREGADTKVESLEGAIQKFKSLSWESFEDFTESTKRIKIICGSPGEWKCTCYRFSREHHCIHSLYLGYLNNEKNVVCKVLENTKLSRTKKARGNTKKARPALAKQPNAPLLAMASESTDPSWANTGHSQIVGSNDTCSAADSTASATATGVESFEI